MKNDELVIHDQIQNNMELAFPERVKDFNSEQNIIQDRTWKLSEVKIEVLCGGTDHRMHHTLKRIFDIVLTLSSLLFLFPMMCFIGILVKLDSSGSALFTQTRVGARRRRINGETVWGIKNFQFYKFRSMFVNADQSLHEAHIKAFIDGTLEASDTDQAKFKLKDDPRITRIGKFLRRTSLDELPQLINVLKGEMSLIGPRPVPVYEAEGYEEHHYERLSAIPGITGLWQIKGRGQVTFEEMIEMDIEYVRNPSLMSDLKILFLTIPAVLYGGGAK